MQLTMHLSMTAEDMAMLAKHAKQSSFQRAPERRVVLVSKPSLPSTESEHIVHSEHTEHPSGDTSTPEPVQIRPSDISIYRYTFTAPFSRELFAFAKVHQYDHRNAFKEAWQGWVEDNHDMVHEEVKHLESMGYQGDALDKMFKSARYYFRKKSTEKKEPAKRRTYIGLHKPLIQAMDVHILDTLLEDMKPSEGFDAFCEKHKDLLKEQVVLLSQAGINDARALRDKIKKTYKNRYFIQVKQIKDCV